MQRNDVTAERLRRLAETSAAGRTVLSAYLDLDPRAFGTAPARASAMRSLLNEAERAVRDRTDLTHDEQRALHSALERLSSYFRDEFSVDGAHAVGVFVSVPDDLFEVVRLPRPTNQQVAIGSAPHIEPLTRMGPPERWAVVLASRAAGRLLRGSPDRLSEVAALDDDVHGQHDQGGWSQARYERSIDEEAGNHVRRVLEALARSHARMPVDRLLIAAPDEAYGFVERHLDQDLRERLVGRVESDVADASLDDVLAAARPVMLEDERRRERAVLDRLSDALGTHGRASASLAGVLDALVQRRVEVLLVAEGFAAPGRACSGCGWLGVEGDRCPVDGGPLEHVDDITERAIECALRQSAQTVFVRHHDDLAAHGGVAALLRF